MSQFNPLIEDFHSNLKRRADRLIASEASGQNEDEDFSEALVNGFEVESERYLEAVNNKSSNYLKWGIPAFILVIILGSVIGSAADSFLIGAVIVAVGCFVLLNLMPKSVDHSAIVENGKQQYFSHVQSGMDAWGARLEQERNDEVAAAEKELEEATAALEAILEPARKSLEEWQALHGLPLPQPYGVSPAGAEAWVCAWMLHMGAEGARITQFVGDGGIDVENKHYIAQVKHYSGSVGVAEVREHIGVAAVDELGRSPLFFTSGTYAAGAVEVAARARMPLFIYSVETAIVEPVNLEAEALIRAGLNPAWLVPEE